MALHSSAFRNFDLKGDKALLLKIIRDMVEHGGPLTPADHWLAVSEISRTDGSLVFDERLYETRYGKLENLLDPWLGCMGMQVADEANWSQYRPYLTRIDLLGLLPSHELDALAAQGWLNADLGSVMDLNLINVYADFSNPGPTRILEVGGGYGRLAEAFYNTFSGTMKYVLVDAVPASIMYAYLYMSKCTSAKVGFYYNDDGFDLDKFDVYVMPSWHFERLNNSEYDISINVESMQEMAQVHVDFYMGLFDAVTRPDGLIYISNAHDYVFKGHWPYPAHWQRLYTQNTPRSWSPDHPTEIFRKGSRDFGPENNLQLLGHAQELAGRRANAELQMKLQEMDAMYWKARREIVDLQDRLKAGGAAQPKP